MSALEILDRAKAAYDSSQSYKARGTVTTDMETAGMKIQSVTSFTMLLKKPDQYLITWTQKGMPMPGMKQDGAVWSHGKKAFLYMGIMKAYAPMRSHDMALASATGISSGAARNIPSCFLPFLKSSPSPLSMLIDPTVEGVSTVGGADCYVVSGSTPVSKKAMLWIDKEHYWIRKIRTSLESPEGGRKLPATMTGDELDKTVNDIGQEVNAESKKQIREAMEKAEEVLNKKGGIKGHFSEVHLDISNDDLSDEAFKFVLPEGAVLKETLFPGMSPRHK